MTNGAGESSQHHDFTTRNMVLEESGIEISQYPPVSSYSNQVVMALDRELKVWQARAAVLERQLELVRQENFSLYCQLKEQKNLTASTPPLRVEKKEVSRKRPNEQNQDMVTEKKARKCRHCGKANHTEKVCWKKTRKCLICGSSKHRIKTCPRFSQRQVQPVSSTPAQQENQKTARRIVENPEEDLNKFTEGQA